jgi:hypothetical protein
MNYDYFLSNIRKKIKQKRSFMSCEITLYQKRYLPLNKHRILESTKKIINDVVTDCLENNSVFTFHKRKK